MPADSTDKTDRLERMMNLVIVLLETSRPLTMRDISDTVAGYPAGEAGRQAFERDKKAIRELGIPLTIEVLPGAGQGYQIKPEDYYLPELGLEEAEEQALAFATAAVQVGGAAGADAMAKLGGPVSEAALRRAEASDSFLPPVGPPVAVLPSLPQLGVIHDALRRNAVLSFKYHGRQRQVEPLGLVFRQAAWYLVGRDRSAPEGPAQRTFRVDRMQSVPQAGDAGAFEQPAGDGLRDAVRFMPWSFSDDESVPVADLVVDARLARVVASQAPPGAVKQWRTDGSVQLALLAGDQAAFVSYVAGLGDAAVVSGPPVLREAVVDRLRAIAQSAPSVDSRVDVPGSDEAAQVPRPGAKGSGPVMASERLRRLLAVLVHLARVGEADIAVLAARFNMGANELVHELELAACCGVPPYSPDQLIELFVDGDRVTADRLRVLARPQRLTPEEGFVLAAAARALLAVPGADAEGALASALHKLETALGTHSLHVDIETPIHLASLQTAVHDGHVVEIDYFASAASAPAVRRVDPYQVVLREGQWYLDGWCHKSDGLRRFQVARVQSVRVLGDNFDRREGLEEALARPGAFLGGSEAVDAVIAFAPGSELALEHLVVGPIVPSGDGRYLARVVVADVEGWFARLLCGLGPESSVLSPPELVGTGQRMAARALAKYRNEGIDR